MTLIIIRNIKRNGSLIIYYLIPDPPFKTDMQLQKTFKVQNAF